MMSEKAIHWGVLNVFPVFDVFLAMYLVPFPSIISILLGKAIAIFAIGNVLFTHWRP